MVQLKSMQVTLPARDVKRAARFYSEVLGFEILGEGPNCTTLAQSDLRLSLIKADPGAASGPSPIQLRFTVGAPQHVDEIAERVRQLDLPVLEEVRQQPDGTRAFTCLGPDDYVIEISAEPVQPLPVEPSPEAMPPPPTTEASAPPSPAPTQPPAATLPPTPPVTETKPATPPATSAPPSPAPAQPPPAAPGRPTRADRYLLEAQERLAKIKEEFASLTVPFSPTDIASTLDEMKQKVARRVVEVVEKAATPSDEEAERERKRREAGEALARYKQVVAQEYQQEPTKPATPEEEEESLKPVKKTLGPAPDDQPPKE